MKRAEMQPIERETETKTCAVCDQELNQYGYCWDCDYRNRCADCGTVGEHSCPADICRWDD